MALRATTKAGYAGGRLRRLGCDHGGGMVNKFPASRHVPATSLRGFPSRRRTRKPAVPAGHEKTAARSARKSRKYDHPTIALSTFQTFNCSTLRSMFVQAKGRFRVPRSGVSCPPRRWFSWSRASASRNDASAKHPRLCTKPSDFSSSRTSGREVRRAMAPLPGNRYGFRARLPLRPCVRNKPCALCVKNSARSPRSTRSKTLCGSVPIPHRGRAEARHSR